MLICTSKNASAVEKRKDLHQEHTRRKKKDRTPNPLHTDLRQNYLSNLLKVHSGFHSGLTTRRTTVRDPPLSGTRPSTPGAPLTEADNAQTFSASPPYEALRLRVSFVMSPRNHEEKSHVLMFIDITRAHPHCASTSVGTVASKKIRVARRRARVDCSCDLSTA